MKDRHDVRECAGEEGQALEALAHRNGEGHFQLLNTMEWKTHPSRRPVTANDSSMMPVYQNTTKSKTKKTNILMVPSST